MNELVTMDVRDLSTEQLGGEIRLLTMQARRMALSYAIQIGYRLRIAHEKVGPHGWAEWLKKETEFSPASASRFESLYEGYGADQGSLLGVEEKFPTLKNLSISNALRLLAVPEEERESFAQEHDVEHMSAREVEALVKERTAAIEQERDAARKELQTTAARLEDTQKSLALSKEAEGELVRKLSQAKKDVLEADEVAEKNERDLKARIKELENRPVEVAVERDEQAIQEAVQAERERLENEREKLISKAANDAADAERAKHAEAEKDYKKKIADLNGQIKLAAAAKDQYEKEIRELSVKAEAAEKAGAESKQLRAQIKDLQGQLTLASPEVAQFKAAFDRAQAELVTMLKALRKVEDTEVKAKLSTAARTVLANFAGQIEG